MKKSLLFTLSAILIIAIGTFFIQEKNKLVEVEKLRAQHMELYENSPVAKTRNLSRDARKALGLPPNAYNEQMWELTMNPATGYPEPYKVTELNERLRALRVPGDASDNAWIERGPNNVGGRTRVVFFDPNDASNSKVYAGAVSGGLWVTNDITTNGGWTQVGGGLPGNINVSSYTIDPNDSNIWYIGTGEQYTAGAAVGNGLYKTEDGGVTWASVAIPPAGGGDINFNPANLFLSGIYYINDVQAWNNAGNTDLFVAVGAHVYGDSAGPSNWLGLQNAGLYRLNGRNGNWSRIDAGMQYVVSGQNYNFIPNDIEVGADNKLWMGTIGSPAFGEGGRVFSSTTGGAWTLEYQVPVTSNATNSSISGNRVEVATSATDADKIYLLVQKNLSQDQGSLPDTSTPRVDIILTEDAFATATTVAIPNDPDSTVPSYDFTRNQAFYDLVIETDPTNDDIVYVGGINLHRSINNGASWVTISHWATGASTNGSLVHADQHALTFRPGNSNQAIVGHDGGVSFAGDLSAVGNNLTAIYPVDDDYNVTQVYHMGVAPSTFNSNSFLGGTQDNGTPFFQGSSTTGPDGQSFDVSGGDGAFSFFDQVPTTGYFISSNTFDNQINLFDYNAGAYRTIASNSNNAGSFINPRALDSNLDLLYSNGPVGTLYRYEGLTALIPNVPAVRTDLTNALLNTSITALDVSPHTTTSTDLILGLVGSRLLRVINADTATPTWTNITPLDIDFVGSVSDVQFGQTTNDIFVTMHNYNAESVWYSDDGGSSWTKKEGDLPDMPVKAILQNPLNLEEVIIGTELGVWRTDNFSAASPNWVQSYNGMSEVKVTDLQLRDDNAVFAATFGRGIYTGQFTAGTLSTEDNVLAKESISIYPKVSNGQITIKSNANLGQSSFEVYNLGGQKVYSSEMELSSNENNITLGLSSGLYIVKLLGDTFTYSNKIIIK